MNELILLVSGGLGAFLTFVVAHDLKQGVVRSSAGLSLLVGLIFQGLSNVVGPVLAMEIPVVFFGASFVGMMGSAIVKNKALILFGGVIFSGIYMGSTEIFVGFGGKLGTTACVSSLLVLGVNFLISRVFNAQKKDT